MMYGSWDIKCKEQSFFVILGHFQPFDTFNNPKNQNFEKIKKTLEILSSYNCVPQMTIIWGIVPEISRATDGILCDFGLFFALYSPNNQENQKFEKKRKKKPPKDIIISQMSTINQNHMMHDSWDMGHNRQHFFSFWTIFCTFTPPPSLNNLRNQNFEWKKKNLLRYHFTKEYHK